MNTIDSRDWDACLKVLLAVEEDPQRALDLPALERQVQRLARVMRKRRRRMQAPAPQPVLVPCNPMEADALESMLPSHGPHRRVAHGSVVLPTAGRVDASLPSVGLQHPDRPHSRRCYVCKRRVEVTHHAESPLCVDCLAREEHKRKEAVDLSGRRALVTGGRTRLGQAVALSLLRNGAQVHVTTRFPEDARQRLASVEDSSHWKQRLHVHGLDLRDIPAVEAFAASLARQLPALEILVHNAAQTNRWPPPGFDELPEGERQRALKIRGDLPQEKDFNSWVMRLHQVPTVELLEALVVNAAAPALLTGHLRTLMMSSPFPDRHVVMVVGADGQYHRKWKTSGHPHVNMSKAALHMLTRTCAEDLAQDHIYLNSVDPGWLSDERPEAQREQQAAQGFQPPLDHVAGAARVLDPVFQGIRGQAVWGLLWKDFHPALW